MSGFGFPKDSQAQATGRRGENVFATFVAKELGWIYRPVPQGSDFGIDGFVDLVESGSVTGRSFAVQIKTGDSYLRQQTAGGIRYRGENRHLNFYLNHRVPVVLVVLNTACDEGHWVQFDIDRTTQEGTGWSIEIPRSNMLTTTVRSKWMEVAGKPEDFSSDIQTLWALNKLIDSDVKFQAFSIPRSDVESGDLDRIQSILTRLSKTKEALLRNRGKLNIFFTGYDDDPREVREIPEVRQWLEKSARADIPWFYFLDTRAPALSVRLLLLGMCAVRVERAAAGSAPAMLSIDGAEISDWLLRHFMIMNKFTRTNGIPEEINQERSAAVLEAVERIQTGATR